MKSKPILAGVDGSPESVRAAALAWRIARAADASCVLVYAVPVIPAIPDDWSPGSMSPMINAPALFDALVGHVRKQIDTELSSDLPVAVRQGLVARLGRPGVVLDEVSREQDAGLVVVGGRHHAALARGFGGSTAHHLVRTSVAPVLVVGASSDLPRRVLVATDLFEAAPPTLATAGRYAGLFEATLRVVHVVEPAKFPTVVPLSLDAEVFEKRSRLAFQRLIEHEVPNVPLDHRVVRRGHADEEIAEEVAAWRADLLIVGSHGKGWIDRLLIGSTTERLLNRLPTSLLVAPIAKPAARTTARRSRAGAAARR